MTTESRNQPRDAGALVLLGSALVALGGGLATVVIALLVAGSDQVRGALVGTALVVTVLAVGAFVVHLVAGMLPTASLLVALLTYTLQLVVLAVALVLVERSEAATDALDREWLAAAVIAATAAWLVGQIWFTARARIPVYELARCPGPGGEEAGAR